MHRLWVHCFPSVAGGNLQRSLVSDRVWLIQLPQPGSCVTLSPLPVCVQISSWWCLVSPPISRCPCSESLSPAASSHPSLRPAGSSSFEYVDDGVRRVGRWQSPLEIQMGPSPVGATTATARMWWPASPSAPGWTPKRLPRTPLCSTAGVSLPPPCPNRSWF